MAFLNDEAVALTETFALGEYSSVFGFLNVQINSPSSGSSILRMVLSKIFPGVTSNC
jgi:hypothetical protein